MFKTTLVACAVCLVNGLALAGDFQTLERDYTQRILPLLKSHCLTCHSTEKQEGELDLEQYQGLVKLRQGASVWLKVIEMLDSAEMPPRDSKQLSPDQLKSLRLWIDDFVAAEADATAGDPGPVMLRRLNNFEYTNSIQQLTGQPLDPAREFPADSAAGEGFTNTGNSLVMSPALLSKYMDAAKGVAEHAILLPDGLRFSQFNTRRDWTDDVLSRLRSFYAQYTDPSGSTRVKLQGLEWDTNAGGRLPLPSYLNALLTARAQLLANQTTPAQAAAEHKLNAKYMETLWSALSRPQSSVLLQRVQHRFQSAEVKDLPQLVTEIAAWQAALTRFQSVGHMKPWLAAVEPIVDRQELRIKCNAPAVTDNGPVPSSVALTLLAGDAGDGHINDYVQWLQPRLVAPGRTDIQLRDVALIHQHFQQQSTALLASTSKCLAAIAEYQSDPAQAAPDFQSLGKKHDVSPMTLAVWFDYLSIAPSGTVRLDQLFTNQLRNSSGYAFVNGWGSPETPSIMASSGDAPVRIPGNMKAHGVVMHPGPALNAVVSWRSPIQGVFTVSGTVTHAHPECGNGVTWAIELRRGNSRQRLAAGFAHGGQPVVVPTIANVRVRAGELVSLLIGPRDGNHSCDLTDVEFKLVEQAEGQTSRTWNLTSDVSPNILAGNPHADSFGNQDTWSFYAEPVQAGETNRAVVPAESLLAKWLGGDLRSDRTGLSAQFHSMLTSARPASAGPDRELWDQAHASDGPLLGNLLDQLTKSAQAGELKALPQAELFSVFSDQPSLQQGLRQPADAIAKLVSGQAMWSQGTKPAEISISTLAPAVIKLTLPRELCQGRDFVVSAMLEPTTGTSGTVQAQVVTGGESTTTAPALTPTLPVIISPNSPARERFSQAANAFRDLFPAALCYTKIVPVDEVVTLALFHRDDDNLQRLMLDDAGRAELDKLWQELHFVSNDLLTVEDAYEQLMQFATQDSDPKLFEHLREPIKQRANDYRASVRAAESHHLASVIDLAQRAFRRPTTDTETAGLRVLYQRLRDEGLNHDSSIRLLIVRVLVSTSFLYRLEHSPSGTGSSPISDTEMASRLSYFLWSAPPDEGLLQAASQGQLHTPDQIAAHTQRMLKDARTRRLASQFACQWLHIQDVATLDEKSERHFPEFAGIRDALQTEAELFFTDLFQADGSVLDVFDADHTFLNEALAKFYKIENVQGEQWRRVGNMRQAGRGGVLTFGATLAKQSGASRTSPILRGNWISEVLLGEKLPKPPKDVPPLPSDEAEGALTVRQLVERHTSDARCSNCHQRIDPFGFALESFDAIGRSRVNDLAGHALDTAVKLPDGAQVANAQQLRAYLVTQKRDVLVRQFCRKLLGYALGRSTQLSDAKLINEMQLQLQQHDYKFSAAIDTLVRSQQFTHIRNGDEQP